MADALSFPPELPPGGEVAAPLPEGVAAPAPSSQPPSLFRYETHRGKFTIGYAILGLLAAGVAAALAILLSSDTPKRSSWSTWQPVQTGEVGAREIAKRVSHVYRLKGGRQIVTVLAGPLEVQQLPVRAVAIRPAATETSQDITIVNAKGAIAFILCGLGQNCSIPQGTPSLERARLLRREALELALYAFKYGGDVTSVTAFLPPKPKAEETYAVFFRKGDLEEQLSKPLTRTLAPVPRITPETLTAEEGRLIDRLTTPHLYQYGFQQAGDGSPVLVLTPVEA